MPHNSDLNVLPWTLAIAVLTNVSCATVGTFLVLRRMSLLGDAISHAVLPGLVLAYMFSGSLAIGGMLIGAFAVGLLTTFLTQALERQGAAAADASMGIVFTSLFALGVVLLKRYVSGVHLDTDCVWQGTLAVAAVYRETLWGWDAPRAIFSVVPVLVVNLLVIGLLWKEFKLIAFDSALATSMGFGANRLHYLLMGLVAATTVSAFESVGSILVIAMLIVPAATAHLLSDRLLGVLLLAMAVAALSAVLGFAAALAWDLEPAGAMAVAVGGLFGLTALLAPRYGVIAALVRNMQMSLRIVGEDLLAMLFRWEELAGSRRLGAGEAVQAVGGGLAPRLALWLLRWRRLVSATPDLQLTADGRQRAARLVRSHRLWEAYLVQTLGLPLDHVHAPAERMEHYIAGELERELAAEIGADATDPHGRAIPSGTELGETRISKY